MLAVGEHSQIHVHRHRSLVSHHRPCAARYNFTGAHFLGDLIDYNVHILVFKYCKFR